MEKDFCYEPPYLKNPTNRNPKLNEEKHQSESCKCFGRKKRSKATTILANFATNLGICVLLFGYTLIGSVIFLAIEGGFYYQQSTTQILATTSVVTKKYFNQTAELKAKNDEARARTVENIWDITVSLNILYRDNWTRLAEQEITRFQNELLKQLGEELTQNPSEEKKIIKGNSEIIYEWSFARAFLYSLTVLTTIGYGSIAPRTVLGKAVTMGYAILGIPLTLLYLSSIGSILSRIARGVFSRTLCCCLCSNCGYCCYDEKRMAEKERRMRKKRQHMELQQQLALQDPFYVRANSNFAPNNLHSPTKDVDSLSAGTDNDSKSSSMRHHGLSILAPILLCFVIMGVYICLGTFVLYKLENWAILDGFYFCFMSLTTIGFGDMVPGTNFSESNTTIWFCSIYIMTGMALTAMCFNVLHDEIVHRLKHQQDNNLLNKINSSDDIINVGSDPYAMTS